MNKVLSLLAAVCLSVACSKPVQPPPPDPAPTVIPVPTASASPVIIKPSAPAPGLPGPGPIATRPAPPKVSPKPTVKSGVHCYDHNGHEVNCPAQLPPAPKPTVKPCREGEVKAVGGSPVVCFVCHDGAFVQSPCAK